jgi:hypothetical protein
MLTMVLLAIAAVWLTTIAVAVGLCVSAASGDHALTRPADVARRPERRARLRPVA